jgi:hypothetical protein
VVILCFLYCTTVYQKWINRTLNLAAGKLIGATADRRLPTVDTTADRKYERCFVGYSHQPVLRWLTVDNGPPTADRRYDRRPFGLPVLPVFLRSHLTTGCQVVETFPEA